MLGSLEIDVQLCFSQDKQVRWCFCDQKHEHSYKNCSASSHHLKTRGENAENYTLVLIKIYHCWRNDLSFHFRSWQCSVALESGGMYHGKSECLASKSQEVVVYQTEFFTNVFNFVPLKRSKILKDYSTF